MDNLEDSPVVGNPNRIVYENNKRCTRTSTAAGMFNLASPGADASVIRPTSWRSIILVQRILAHVKTGAVKVGEMISERRSSSDLRRKSPYKINIIGVIFCSNQRPRGQIFLEQ